MYFMLIIVKPSRSGYSLPVLHRVSYEIVCRHRSSKRSMTCSQVSKPYKNGTSFQNWMPTLRSFICVTVSLRRNNDSQRNLIWKEKRLTSKVNWNGKRRYNLKEIHHQETRGDKKSYINRNHSRKGAANDPAYVWQHLNTAHEGTSSTSN